MRSALILLLIGVYLTACNNDGKEQNNDKEIRPIAINHYNITIAADLSNRLNPNIYPKAVSDTAIVDLIMDNIYPRILTHQRSINQLDQFRIDFINKMQINAYNVQSKSLEIDFKRYANRQSERIEYIRKNFDTDLVSFKEEFKRINEKAIKKPYGSDIWTYLNEGINNNIVDNAKSYSSFDGHLFMNQQENVLVLLTDGYIEAGLYGSGYDLSGKKLRQFRTTFEKSGEPTIQQFYKKHPEYHIKALQNPLLKDLDILVLEMYDRTESNQGATVHPTDMEIMRIFWYDWLKRSGVKRVELHPKFSNKTEAEKVIMKFIGV